MIPARVSGHVNSDSLVGGISSRVEEKEVWDINMKLILRMDC